MKNFTKIRALVLSGIAALLISFTGHRPEEGMYPISQIASLDLAAAGLKIDKSEIFDPNGKGLNNALVRLGGCTGSFVSETGLIFTNHHCVYGTVAALSTPENNYLDNGFYAADTSAELKTSLPCKIMLSFEDVSEAVLEGITDETSPADKADIISKNMLALRLKEQVSNPDLTIEISEMFVGKYYTLFRYKVLNDVRIVYVPPRSVGKFGGESDNWVWPRHNGDFSIVRAYENGKPYQPVRHLQINPAGSRENDFVFVMGYPGRTYRHQPGQFLQYQRDYVLPVISDWFDYRIRAMEEDAGNDKAVQLKYAGAMASLSNVTKNFKGKMQGFKRTNILQDRYKEQEELKAWVNDKDLDQYKGLFEQIDERYDFKYRNAVKYLYLNQLNGSSGVFFAARFIATYREQLENMSREKRDSFLTDHKVELQRSLSQGYRILSEELDRKLFTEILYRLAQLAPDQRIAEITRIAGENPDREKIAKFVQKCYKKTRLVDRDKMMELFSKDPAKFFGYQDELVKFVSALAEETERLNNAWDENEDGLNAILPRISDLKDAYYKGTFVPDANSTLRLTYGYVKGYSPEDAVYNQPFTTLQGIFEKAQSEGDYFLEENILARMHEVEPADVLRHPGNRQVVVGFLYNLDTTGGNSGSPVLNDKGEVIGINFDRAFSATINDYAWNESYSRSIGVDIRYVLYVIKYLSHADPLISEMGVAL